MSGGRKPKQPGRPKHCLRCEGDLQKLNGIGAYYCRGCERIHIWVRLPEGVSDTRILDLRLGGEVRAAGGHIYVLHSGRERCQLGVSRRVRRRAKASFCPASGHIRIDGHYARLP